VEKIVHGLNRTNLAWYGLAAACLVLAGAGFVKAKGQADAKQESNSSAASSASSTASDDLDYEFFKAKVEPIFLKKREGHARCVSCHVANHVKLHLVALTPGSKTWNEEQSRQNFDLIHNVAIPGDLQSPILIHPLAEDAGGDFFHSGGKHFNSQSDPEWLTLKAFVMGETKGK